AIAQPVEQLRLGRAPGATAVLDFAVLQEDLGADRSEVGLDPRPGNPGARVQLHALRLLDAQQLLGIELFREPVGAPLRGRGRGDQRGNHAQSFPPTRRSSTSTRTPSAEEAASSTSMWSRSLGTVPLRRAAPRTTRTSIPLRCAACSRRARTTEVSAVRSA